MPGDLTYTREKFVRAADDMATTEGSLRDRLRDAYLSHVIQVAHLEPGIGGSISDELADSIRELHHQMTMTHGPEGGPEGAVAATIAAMDDSVHNAAAALMGIARDLDREWYRNNP